MVCSNNNITPSTSDTLDELKKRMKEKQESKIDENKVVTKLLLKGNPSRLSGVLQSLFEDLENEDEYKTYRMTLLLEEV